MPVLKKMDACDTQRHNMCRGGIPPNPPESFSWTICSCDCHGKIPSNMVLTPVSVACQKGTHYECHEHLTIDGCRCECHR
jgi:hypothetical protein